MSSRSPDAPQNLYEIQWAAKTAEDRGDVFRVDAMLQRIAYLEELRVKLEKDIEFDDLSVPSPRYGRKADTPPRRAGRSADRRRLRMRSRRKVRTLANRTGLRP